MVREPRKEYQIIAMALHRTKPLVDTEGSVMDMALDASLYSQWNADVLSVGRELSDSAYLPEFLQIADTGKVPGEGR